MINFKDMVKKNLHLKIFSVAAAILLWVVIQIVQHPELSFSFGSLPIETVNESVLEERGLTVLPKLEETVKVNVKAQRWDLNTISDEDFKVYVDLSNVYTSGMVELPVKVRLNNEFVQVSSVSPATVWVSIDKIVTEEKPLNIHITGSLRDAYYTNDSLITSDVKTIMVKGPKKLVDTVASCVATVDITNKTESYEEEAKVFLVDNDGSAVSSSGLVALTDTINAKIQILTKKVVPVVLTGIPSNIKYTVIPASVEIAGPKASVDKIDKITVSRFMFEKQTVGFKQKVKISLPDGIINLNENATEAQITEIISEDISDGEE